MKNKENSINFCKEIYLKCDVRGINSFDRAVFRINTKEIYVRPERLVCSVYIMPNENGVILCNSGNKILPGTLLATIKGKPSGWIEWTVDSQLNEFRENKDLLLKIVVREYNRTVNINSAFYENIK